MGEAFGSIVAIKQALEADGSLMLQVADFGGKPFGVRLDPEDVRSLLSKLQKALTRQIEGTGKEGAYLQAAIQQVQLAYHGSRAALLVTTDQLGAIALTADKKMLLALRDAVDRALEHSGPRH